MRQVTLTDVDIVDVWINAYYTSFPCRQCSLHGDEEDKHEVLVFHLTPPRARKCLSLKYTKRYERVEVVNYKPDCVSVIVSTPRLHRQR
ncbi:hypothetical protein AAVH_23786 [Aphelenchoides avenae]|nr:hypothetical protein AAVH_23786 [Aphelenchus avenae]